MTPFSKHVLFFVLGLMGSAVSFWPSFLLTRWVFRRSPHRLALSSGASGVVSAAVCYVLSTTGRSRVHWEDLNPYFFAAAAVWAVLTFVLGTVLTRED